MKKFKKGGRDYKLPSKGYPNDIYISDKLIERLSFLSNHDVKNLQIIEKYKSGKN